MLKNMLPLMRVLLEGILRVLPATCGILLYLKFLRKDAMPWVDVLEMFAGVTLVAGLTMGVIKLMMLAVKNKTDYDKRSIYRDDNDSKEEGVNTH